ncbi:MAG TPA: hypothetical protein VK446_06240 [Methylocystis sp.]|nr:hypothetical protein [Methylocystis sp.]
MRRLKLVLLAPVLFSALAGAASSGASAAGRKPQFVIDAERNYAQARQERVVAQERVARLGREETREGRAALASAGQWIEPSGLWREQLAAEQNLAFAQSHERYAFDELNRARDAARRMRVGGAPQPEPLSSPFWWLW